MRKKIPIIISSVLIILTLCFFTIFLVSVNQAKNIVRLINEKNYEDLEYENNPITLTVRKGNVSGDKPNANML